MEKALRLTWVYTKTINGFGRLATFEQAVRYSTSRIPGLQAMALARTTAFVGLFQSSCALQCDAACAAKRLNHWWEAPYNAFSATNPAVEEHYSIGLICATKALSIASPIFSPMIVSKSLL